MTEHYPGPASSVGEDAVPLDGTEPEADAWDFFHPVSEGGGFTCCWCGADMHPSEFGTTIDGRTGAVAMLTNISPQIRVYHPRCREARRVARRRAENHHLSEWAEA